MTDALRGSLYLVATPIGHLEDITLRALRVLREASLVLAEDTRHTRVLLERHGIPARPVSLHAHNEAARCEAVLAALAAGRDVALVSDAGTPLVSDPGERLVAAALEGGFAVVPVPGASAVLAALSASGLPPLPFVFVGFPPRRARAREALFSSYRSRPETLVLFESPHRTAATLQALAAALGPRRACVARELTKLHEEFARGTLPELAARYADGARGEVTIVVAGAPAGTSDEAPPAAPPAANLEARIAELAAAGHSARDIATRLARETGLPRRHVYALASRKGPSRKGPG
ncbi:16S rRNA (cytidine(1402)-2'-O)-methyltransferase [Myxococcota bacterium]|nr:16S rRNA (cytidine(1402)-2'-O)-methyltransferase [Myxococcota bacterium]